MNRNRVSTFFLCLFGYMAIAQDSTNVKFIANVNEFAALEYNDCWGFRDNKGVEFAVIGTTASSLVYNLSNPAKPVKVADIPGDLSLWRDFKYYKGRVYGIADRGDDGGLVIDMTTNPVSWKFYNMPVTVDGQNFSLQRCHNLFIDTLSGHAYYSGCGGIAGGGVLIFDIKTPNGEPVFKGHGPQVYSHDNVVYKDTIYSSDIQAGYFSITDAKDKSNPKLIATQFTSSFFTHNAWFSDDAKLLFTTDERGNAFIDAYDISNKANIRRLDSWRPLATEGQGVIPHNVHYKDGWLIISHYTDGVKIVDAHRPENLIEVGGYDTWTGVSGGFNGCWGAYPWLPSGLLLASDISTGLYVLKPNYVRACYLEGTVRDAITKQLLPQARIKILSDIANKGETNGMGTYKTGQWKAGTFSVEVSRAGYQTKIVQATLVNGQITLLDVELLPDGVVSSAYEAMNANIQPPFPNPSKSGFQLSLSSDIRRENLVLEVYSVLGVRVLGVRGDKLHQSWGNELPAGSYKAVLVNEQAKEVKAWILVKQ